MPHKSRASKAKGKERDKVFRVLLVVAAVLTVVIIGIAGYAASQLFGSSQDQTAYVELPVTIEVPEGASTEGIAQILYDAQLISKKDAFLGEVKDAGLDGKLKSGTYVISTTDVKEIVAILMEGADVSLIKLTIPEGFTNKQIAARVKEVIGIPEADFLAISDHKAEEYADRYFFLQGAYEGSMEGYLFPKTYMVPEGANADYVVTTMLNQFRKEIGYIDTSWVESKNYSLSDLVVIASIIEKEASVAEERKLVSSVIFNRLEKDMRLQVCASVEYILGTRKLRLSAEDISIDSPYNTYKHDGLPPGPISNPGLESLKAASHPAETNYLFYVLTGKDGSQTFSETLEQHNAATAESKRVFGE